MNQKDVETIHKKVNTIKILWGLLYPVLHETENLIPTKIDDIIIETINNVLKEE